MPPQLSSCSLAVLFPQNSTVTPVAAVSGNIVNYRAAYTYFSTYNIPQLSVYYQPQYAECHLVKKPLYYFPQQAIYYKVRTTPVSGPLLRSSFETVNCSQCLYLSPIASLSVMGTVAAKSVQQKPRVAEMCATNSVTTVTPCFSKSLSGEVGRVQLTSCGEDRSLFKCAFQEQPISRDSTPKRKKEKRSVRRSRRQQEQQQQQQQLDKSNFAGAKFSESPQARVLPLPPFLWREETSSSSSCSGDEMLSSSVSEITEAESGGKNHGTPDEKASFQKCRSIVRMTPLQLIAAVTNL